MCRLVESLRQGWSWCVQGTKVLLCFHRCVRVLMHMFVCIVGVHKHVGAFLAIFRFLY